MKNMHPVSKVFLAHDHSMYGLAHRREQGERAVFSNHYAPLIRQAGVNVIGWVVGGDPPFFGIENQHAWQGSLELLEMIWQETKESQDTLAICLDSKDIDNAISEQKIALILTMEGGLALEQDTPGGSLENLRTLHRLGLRSLQLMGQKWNQMMDAIEEHPHPTKGLTEYGKKIIQEMNRLGMVIDLAHIPDPDPLAEEIIELSQDPVIDSHRGVRGATNIPRNLSDERIKAIANTGGVIGLQFFSIVLSNDPNRRATVDDLFRHIDHIVEVAGIDHVSLGPDFLEAKLTCRKPDHYAAGMEDITCLPQVTEALVKHGYSEAEIRKVLGENILRVYKRLIG